MTIINKNVNLGFMQGRLSPMIENMIQRFPIDNWKHEILLSEVKGFINQENPKYNQC